MKTHITHTGYLAGLAWCDLTRHADDANCHLPYGSVEKVSNFVNKHITCEDCLEAFQVDYIGIKSQRGLSS